MNHVKEKLKEIFDTTLENELLYEGKFSNIEYYSLFCKAAANEHLYKLQGNNICMFNT